MAWGVVSSSRLYGRVARLVGHSAALQLPHNSCGKEKDVLGTDRKRWGRSCCAASQTSQNYFSFLLDRPSISHYTALWCQMWWKSTIYLPTAEGPAVPIKPSNQFCHWAARCCQEAHKEHCGSSLPGLSPRKRYTEAQTWRFCQMVMETDLCECT